MDFRRCLALLAIVLLTDVSYSAQWWDNKSYLEWSSADLEDMLFNSPWVKRSTAGIQHIGWRENRLFSQPFEPNPERSSSLEKPSDMENGVRRARLDPSAIPDSRFSSQAIRVYYQVRLLTAKPVREAFLRRLSYAPDILSPPNPVQTVNIDDIKKEIAAGEEKARLESFIKSNPRDIRVREEPEFIVLSIATVTFVRANTKETSPDQSGMVGLLHSPEQNARYFRSRWLENACPANFLELEFADFQKSTYITTTKTKRVLADRYESPSSDGLGAKLYFPRLLPDGTPLVTTEDKELRFETKIAGTKIRAKFDLRKLYYKGSLEF